MYISIVVLYLVHSTCVHRTSYKVAASATMYVLVHSSTTIMLYACTCTRAMYDVLCTSRTTMYIVPRTMYYVQGTRYLVHMYDVPCTMYDMRVGLLCTTMMLYVQPWAHGASTAYFAYTLYYVLCTSYLVRCTRYDVALLCTLVHRTSYILQYKV